MKKGLLALLVLGSISAFADVDYGSYCAKYLKGDLTDKVKPSILEDFIPEDGQFTLADNTTKVKSMVFKLSPVLEKAGGQLDTQTSLVKKGEDEGPAAPQTGGKSISTNITSHNDRKNVEVQTLTVKRPSKNGKMVKDYTLIITRDMDGKILSIKKNHNLLSFKAQEKLNFIYKNNTCIPNEQFTEQKRDFNTTMCRELQEFYNANPAAKECSEKGYDIKVKDIVEKYDRAGAKVIGFFRTKKYGGSLLSGKALGDCADAGLTDLVEKNEVWKEEVAPVKEPVEIEQLEFEPTESIKG
ncbi:MAG: hypothetical protein ACOYL6_18330 [Bacteriovoracaceae bacterium]